MMSPYEACPNDVRSTFLEQLVITNERIISWNLSMYVCMYVCVCVYVCMYVCVYVCMYACMYVGDYLLQNHEEAWRGNRDHGRCKVCAIFI